MGLSSSKSTTQSGPSPYQQSQLSPAIGEITRVYNDNKGANASIASGIQGLIPGLLEKYNTGDPNVSAARGYNSDVLGGKYLGGNPYATSNGYLDQIINQTAGDVTDRVKAGFGSRGSFGGTKYVESLSRGLADSENNLRYGDFNTTRQMNADNYARERGNQQAAATGSTAFGASDNLNLQAILQAAQSGTDLPFSSVNDYGSLIASLVGNNGQQTSKSSDGGASLIGSALTAAALAFSDPRLKSNVVRIGAFPDGLGLYEYDIFGAREWGVMADEVADLRPWALGPEIGGFRTVNYGAL